MLGRLGHTTTFSSWAIFSFFHSDLNGILSKKQVALRSLTQSLEKIVPNSSNHIHYNECLAINVHLKKRHFHDMPACSLYATQGYVLTHF